MAHKTELQKRVDELVAEHGTLRAAGAALKIDHTLLWRIQTGRRVGASDETLKKLGFHRIPERIEPL
jgi:hypothetical protein